jgi:3-(3-hydroxy-phenyl)propionate hydroxylase
MWDIGYEFYNAAGRLMVKVDPRDWPMGYPKRSGFRQPHLEVCLRKGAERFPNVAGRFGHEALEISQDDEAATLALRAPDGEPIRVRAQYVVGADGARSLVRQAIGARMLGSTYARKWLVLDTLDDPDEYRTSKLICDPRRPVISIRGPHGTRRFELMLHPHERDEDMLRDEAIEAALRPHLAPGQRLKVARKTIYTHHARVADRWRSGRLFLVGDAAHLTPPFAGQGMNTGCRDVNNLAWKLAHVLRGKAGAGLLESYEAERRKHAADMVRLAVQIGYVAAPASGAFAAALDWSFRALNLAPPLKRYFAEMRYRPRPRLTDGFVLPDGQPAKRTLVGVLLPQPNVAAASGEVPLDRALGNGFALVAHGAGAREALAAADGEAWRRLGARRVAVLPGGAGPTDGDPVTTVGATCDRLSRFMAANEGRILAVRPDRQIAGSFLASEAAAFEHRFARLLSQTAK